MQYCSINIPEVPFKSWNKSCAEDVLVRNKSPIQMDSRREAMKNGIINKRTLRRDQDVKADDNFLDTHISHLLCTNIYLPNPTHSKLLCYIHNLTAKVIYSPLPHHKSVSGLLNCPQQFLFQFESISHGLVQDYCELLYLL